ncbi:MAG TPA: hypothetical protein VD788_02665, partial [Candidatus Polarisedimenticolaceae bacterium]|nr:hypothetical protein [Candidatus Polarisedimenticolaceae bacterium]
MRTPPARRLRPIAALSVTLCAALGMVFAPTAADEPDAPPAWMALGISLDSADAVPDGIGDDLAGFRVRLVVDWNRIERPVGVYDWSRVADRVDAVLARGAEVVLCLTGSHLDHVAGGVFPDPADVGAIDAWLAFVRAAVTRFAGRIEAIEVWDASTGSAIDPEDYAYVLKTTALAARAEASARGATIRIAQLAVSAAEIEWQRRLWQRDVAAYIDILPLDVRTEGLDRGIDSRLATMMAENLRHPPAAEVWAHVGAGIGFGPWLPVTDALRALAAGVPVAIVRPPADPQPRGEVAGWLAGTHRLVRRGFAPAPLGAVRFEGAQGGELRGARAIAAFLADE